ncbi:MAG: sucrase ferredoxin [Actinomycetota bacterium]
MTSLDHLLPPADDTVRCAEHARSIGVDPGGTAIRADRVVLVAVPAPWPKPALGHPLLAELSGVLAEGPTPTRLLAAAGPGFGPTGDGVPVVVYDRLGGGATERRFVVADGDDLATWGRTLVGGDVRAPSEPAMASAALGPWARHDPSPCTATPAVLVCTQGSHDVCCGSEGERFARAAADDGIDVYRVSHTGGHRFAPTALTIPDGRMWADLDLDLLRRIMGRLGPLDEVTDHCRGWWGAATGPAQMAERAVFAHLGWEFGDDDRGVSVIGAEGASDPDRTMVVVEWGDERWVVDVRVARTVPSIACRAPGGLPAKAGREYVVADVRSEGPR